MKHHIRDNQLILDVRVMVPGEKNIETFRAMIDTGADMTLNRLNIVLLAASAFHES